MSAWNKEVLFLYRRLLRLHAALPPELRALGNGYLREEFRRHRGADDAHVTAFKKEWSRFADMLSDQVDWTAGSMATTSGLVDSRVSMATTPGRVDSTVSTTTTPGQVGSNLPPEILDRFRDEQIGQLYKLKLETTSYRQSHLTGGEDSKS